MNPDHPFVEWPNELLQSYKDLPLPTLYEFAVAKEKLSLEIRKQNKEIKQLSDIIKELTNQVIQLHDRPEEDKKLYQKSLIQAFDSIWLLKEQVFKSSEQVPRDLVFKKGKFTKKQAGQSQKVENTLDSLLEGLELIEDKFLTSLADVGLMPFIPLPGDVFIPQEHRAVIQLPGGELGKIHKTVRIGYRSSKEVLRYADVAVYQGKKESYG
jgi:molecular chaperone GrpE (heat shock protein)